LARLERAELQRRIARTKRVRGLAFRIGLTVLVVAIAGSALILTRARSPESGPQYVNIAKQVDPASLPSILTGRPPWPANTEALRPRLQAIGLPALSFQGTALHIHQHLDLYVAGKKVTIPADIGIAQTASGVLFSPIHTHDTSGIIHVESPTVRPFTLGEFFDVWGVRFTPDCIGGDCNNAGARLRVYVNGHLVTGDPAAIRLTSHEEIVVIYGTHAQLPSPIPSGYTFPTGY
jgi:hypothetical protein